MHSRRGGVGRLQVLVQLGLQGLLVQGKGGCLAVGPCQTAQACFGQNQHYACQCDVVGVEHYGTSVDIEGFGTMACQILRWAGMGWVLPA